MSRCHSHSVFVPRNDTKRCVEYAIDAPVPVVPSFISFADKTSTSPSASSRRHQSHPLHRRPFRGPFFPQHQSMHDSASAISTKTDDSFVTSHSIDDDTILTPKSPNSSDNPPLLAESRTLTPRSPISQYPKRVSTSEYRRTNKSPKKSQLGRNTHFSRDLNTSSPESLVSSLFWVGILGTPDWPIRCSISVIC
ncbi:hypothetical protein BLNAU_11243 [Blattamonas nauphoetae]|uniref:Uncharacterized protein n=1 Tax=Blattamonas nauphoetae TaxID=2049346 RepID=A0ABQ9XQQ1_9EUKA|nr:hypothetical protein BLNAU_11243 [Blattamonas nauphoetae]